MKNISDFQSKAWWKSFPDKKNLHSERQKALRPPSFEGVHPKSLQTLWHEPSCVFSPELELQYMPPQISRLEKVQLVNGKMVASGAGCDMLFLQRKTVSWQRSPRSVSVRLGCSPLLVLVVAASEPDSLRSVCSWVCVSTQAKLAYRCAAASPALPGN